MKLNNLALITTAFIGFGSASALKAFDWSACKGDVAKDCPKGTAGDEAIFSCLEKNDAKLSKKCSEAHEAYETQMGKIEKEEPKEESEHKTY